MKKLVKGLSKELEACPFCRKHNLIHTIYMSGGQIECQDCGAMGPELTLIAI
jgi:hypothetical protein